MLASNYFIRESLLAWETVKSFIAYATDLATPRLKKEIENAATQLQTLAGALSQRKALPNSPLSIERLSTKTTIETTIAERIFYLLELINQCVLYSDQVLQSDTEGKRFPEFKIIWGKVVQTFSAKEFTEQDWRISHPDALPNSPKPVFAESMQFLDRQIADGQLIKLQQQFPTAELITDNGKYRLKIPDLTNVVGLWLHQASSKAEPADEAYIALIALAKHYLVKALDAMDVDSGKTTLHRAASAANLSKVTALLTHGAKATQDNDKKMPGDLVPATAKFPEDIMQQLKGLAPTLPQQKVTPAPTDRS